MFGNGKLVQNLVAGFRLLASMNSTKNDTTKSILKDMRRPNYQRLSVIALFR